MWLMKMCGVLFAFALMTAGSPVQTTSRGGEPTGELARRLADVEFDYYSEAPGYSEGPTWRDGDVFFCSGALLRATGPRQVHKYLEIGPAGTVLLGNGHC